jgi:hypothetical protein
VPQVDSELAGVDLQLATTQDLPDQRNALLEASGLRRELASKTIRPRAPTPAGIATRNVVFGPRLQAYTGCRRDLWHCRP